MVDVLTYLETVQIDDNIEPSSITKCMSWKKILIKTVGLSLTPTTRLD